MQARVSLASACVAAGHNFLNHGRGRGQVADLCRRPPGGLGQVAKPWSPLLSSPRTLCPPPSWIRCSPASPKFPRRPQGTRKPFLPLPLPATRYGVSQAWWLHLLVDC